MRARGDFPAHLSSMSMSACFARQPYGVTRAMSKPGPRPASKPAAACGRWLPLIGLAMLMALAFAMGWHKYLSFKTIVHN